MANFPEISGLMDCSNIKLTEIFVPKYSFILALKSNYVLIFQLPLAQNIKKQVNMKKQTNSITA